MRIAIVGAGPAGLTAAIAAAQSGLTPIVFEGADDFARIGGGIAIQSNGLRVLDRLGVLPSFATQMSPCRKLVLDLAGRHQIVSDLGELPIPHNDFAVVLRYRLQEHLLAAARKVSTIHFGHRCTHIEQRRGLVLLRFANGVEADCDVLIGADGAHSEIRRCLGVPVVERSAGDAYLRGVSAFASAGSDQVVREIWGPDGRRFGIAPLADAQTYFFCSAPRGEWEATRSHRLPEWINTWRSYGGRVADILRHVEDWEAVNYDEPEEIRLTRWYSLPVFLIGDAAHAMTPNYGQGANAAMVDAFVLATLLARSRHDPSSLVDVGRAYEHIRRRFVARTQTAARRLGIAAQWTSPLAIGLRDSVIRMLSRSQTLRRRDLLLVAGYNPREAPYF
jgi:2-polyprenyl-6-methoxyphenol hydroxylase-like FAD-dependent oxidoreductase